MKIERPDWPELNRKVNKIPEDDRDIAYLFTADAFNLWFDTHVEPINKMLSEGQDAWCNSVGLCAEEWTFTRKKHDCNNPIYKALLINIEPIKKETAEDVLRDVVSQWHSGGFTVETIERAKRVFGESDG